MGGRRPELVIELSPGERAFLLERAQQRQAPHLEVIRARALLMAADGARNVDIARVVGVGARTITIWRRSFRESGLACLKEKPRSGRPRLFSPCGQSGSDSSGLPGPHDAHSADGDSGGR